jgi:hypothetical protein
MDRRRFLKSAAGLFIPAAPALILPKLVRAQGGMGPGPGMVHSTGGGLGLQTGCTGFWSFENTSWLDDTGNGTTLTPTASPTAVAGKVGNAVSLNGSTQFLRATSNANILNGGSSFSIQAWVNLSAGVSEFQIFSKSANSFGNIEWGFGIRFTSANVWSFYCSNTGPAAFRAEDTVGFSTSTWTHLVGTFNSSGGAMILYKNGSQVGTATLTGTMNSTASAPLNVGNDGTAIIPAAVLVDQCGFWKGRVLSAGDVTSLYNSGNGLTWAAML